VIIASESEIQYAILRTLALREFVDTGLPTDEFQQILKKVNPDINVEDSGKISKALQELAECELITGGMYKDTPVTKITEMGLKKWSSIDSEKEKLHVVWERDLKNIVNNPIEWRIKNFIPNHSTVFVGGKGGSCKTWSVLDMAISLTTGLPFLNSHETQKSKVLFIDEESGIEEIKRRIDIIKKGRGIIGDIENLCFASYQGIKVDTEFWRKRLENFLNEYKPDIIITDCFRRIIGCEENDATAINDVFTNVLSPIKERYNITWILVHHLRKGLGRGVEDLIDELRGSSDIVNIADMVLVFQRIPKVDNKFKLLTVKSRRTKSNESRLIEMQWNEFDSMKMVDLGTAQEIFDSVDLCMRAIEVWITENATISFVTKDVKKEMKKQGYSEKTTQRALTVLTQQGKVLREKKGHYRTITENISDYVEGTEGQKGQDPKESLSLTNIDANKPKTQENQTKKEEIKDRDNEDKVYSNGSSVPSMMNGFRDKKDNTIMSVPSVPNEVSKYKEFKEKTSDVIVETEEEIDNWKKI